MDLQFERKTRISFSLLRLAMKLNKLDHQTRSYGTDEKLFDAEIHMIKAVEENEGIHVTGLADLLGITKGAVSQTMCRLMAKGMLEKEQDPKNASRLNLRLTPKGKTAYRHHEQLHAQFTALVDDSLSDASTEQLAFLNRFLSGIENGIDAFPNH